MHIDATFNVIGPGRVLVNPDRPCDQVIVISFLFSEFLSQETAKGPYSLQSSLSCHFVYLFTTLDEGFTLYLLVLNVKQRSCKYQFLWFLV